MTKEFKQLKREGKEIVITYGTFDYLHEGHINILKGASSQGDFLVVGVSSDKFNEVKGKPASRYTQEERVKKLEELDYIDYVILEESWDQKPKDFAKFKVDKFVMGSDWEGKFDYYEDVVEVVYLPRTKGVSSTQLRLKDETYKK